MCNGEVAALAWPQTNVRKVGMWYDHVLTWLGICKENYYIAGHAALIIADKENNTFLYFDFGRYHTPHQYGRVRSKFTDPELHIPILPMFDLHGYVTNWEHLCEWLNKHKACHGEGDLHIGIYQSTQAKKVLNAALNLQHSGLVRYGLFERNSSNCSRFVRNAICEGLPFTFQKIMLLFPPMLTPTTRWNIRPAHRKAYFVISTNGTANETEKISLA
jgi:hypothetical protein